MNIGTKYVHWPKILSNNHMPCDVCTHQTSNHMLHVTYRANYLQGKKFEFSIQKLSNLLSSAPGL